MLPFDVILFDVGNVLLTNGWDTKGRAAVIEQFKLDLAAFEARHPEPNDRWEKDEITAKEYMDATVFYEPRPFTHDDFLNAILGQSALIPNTALPVLKELAGLGKYLVGSLNNEAREPNEYRFKEFGLSQYFEVSLSSCYLGLRKPGLAIYKRAIDILGKPAERILFIDDRMNNVEAARAVGITTIHFTDAEDLRRELETLKIF